MFGTEDNDKHSSGRIIIINVNGFKTIVIDIFINNDPFLTNHYYHNDNFQHDRQKLKKNNQHWDSRIRYDILIVIIVKQQSVSIDIRMEEDRCIWLYRNISRQAAMFYVCCLIGREENYKIGQDRIRKVFQNYKHTVSK
ncbi:hypothetical protein ACH3XW_43600 [Acanthocheilonema viteae]